MSLPSNFYNGARETSFLTGYGVVGFSCYDLLMGEGDCQVLIPRAACVCCRVDNYGFPSFALGCAFDSAFT